MTRGLRFALAFAALGWVGLCAAQANAQKNKACRPIMERASSSETYPALELDVALESGVGASSHPKTYYGRLGGEAKGAWYGLPYRGFVSGMIGEEEAQKETLESGGAHWGLEGRFLVEALHRGGDTALLSMDEDVALGVGFVMLELRYSQERPVRFGDRFWRPGAGLYHAGWTLNQPALMLMQCGRWEARLFSTQISIDTWNYHEEESRVSVSMVNLTRNTPVPLRIKVLDIETFTMWSVPHVTLSRYPSVKGLTFGIVEVDGLPLGTSGRQTLDFGLQWNALRPAWLHPTDADASSDAEDERPRWGALSAHVGTTWHHERLTFGGRLGTFERLDPTGYAVDYGGRLSLNARWTLSDLIMELNAEGISAPRVMISPLARVHGVDVGSTGSVLWMGRAEAQTTVLLGDGLSVLTSVWGERSDRNDPIHIGGPVVFRPRQVAGAWMTLRFEPE